MSVQPQNKKKNTLILCKQQQKSSKNIILPTMGKRQTENESMESTENEAFSATIKANAEKTK